MSRENISKLNVLEVRAHQAAGKVLIKITGLTSWLDFTVSSSDMTYLNKLYPSSHTPVAIIFLFVIPTQAFTHPQSLSLASSS